MPAYWIKPLLKSFEFRAPTGTWQGCMLRSKPSSMYHRRYRLVRPHIGFDQDEAELSKVSRRMGIADELAKEGDTLDGGIRKEKGVIRLIQLQTICCIETLFKFDFGQWYRWCTCKSGIHGRSGVYIDGHRSQQVGCQQ